MILLIIISIILLFLVSVLVLPIRLVLNSQMSKYFIEIPIYFRAQLVPENQLFFIKLRLLFIPIKINPFKKRKNRIKKTEKSIQNKIKTNTSNTMNLIPKGIKLLTIKKADANIDTGDFPLNAQLIPVAQMLNNKNIHLQINFENKNTIDLEIFTQLYKLIWMGIINKIKTN